MSRIRHYAPTLLAGILAACGESPADPQPPGDDDAAGPFTQVACPALSLDATTGLPMERIAIGELPSAFESPSGAAIIATDQTIEGFASVLPDTTGALHLIVPLHPESHVSGGAVQLMFTDSVVACAPVDFTIQPMPAAEGEFAAVVDLFQDILTDQAALMGTTPAELIATPLQDLPLGLWPLAIAQTTVDDPANDSSLRAFVDGLLDAEALDLANRLLALTDVRSSLEGTQPAPPPTEFSVTTAIQQIPFEDCTVDAVGSSASQLELCMDAGVDAYDQASGFSDKVATDIITAITVTYEAFGDSPLGLIQFAFGTLSWATYMELENVVRTFPSSYVSMSITVDREHFLEDEDAQGRVTDAQVLAASAGWDPQDAIEDAVNKIQTAIDWGLSEELAPFSEEIAESIGGMIAQRLEDGSDLSDVVVPPEEFGPVDFLDPARLHVFVDDGDAIAVVEGITYEPRREGEATLKVQTAQRPPVGFEARDEVEIMVRKIEVGITPTDTILLPGGSATLSAWTTEAMFPAFVDLHQPENLQGTATISYNENTSFHEVTYTAPAQPNFGVPDTLTVLDTASTGARAAPDAPVRNARAVIRFASVKIVPVEDCLNLGATHQFEASVQGLDNDALEWDASVGDMDDDGFYQAPPNSPDDGVAVIVARSVEHPELVDSTRVNIGCACTFSISVGDAIATDTPGRRLEFGALSGDVPPPEDNIVLVIRIDEDTTGNYSLTMGISPEQLANAPGTYTLELSGEFPMQPPDLGYYNTPDATVSLDILHYIPEQLLVGTAYGSVEVVTEVGPGEFDERIEPFVMSFEIRVPEGWDPPSTVFGQLYACRVGGGES